MYNRIVANSAKPPKHYGVVIRISWTQPFYSPAFLVIFRILEPIVEPTIPSLPKLNHLWYHSQASPEFGYRNILHALESLLHIPDPPLQHLPSPFLFRQNLTLLTRPCPNPGPSGPQPVVALTLLTAQSLHLPFHPNLPLDLVPPKRQARARIAPHVFGLAARAPIAVDDEAGSVEFFQVDVAA